MKVSFYAINQSEGLSAFTLFRSFKRSSDLDVAMSSLNNSVSQLGNSILASKSKDEDREFAAEQNNLDRNFNAEQAQLNRNFQHDESLLEYQRQQQMQSEQNAFNVDMWNKTNEYNSIGSQLLRAQAAGVNPNMYISGGNNVSSQPVQASSQGAQATPAGSAATHSGTVSYGYNPWNLNAADAMLKAAEAQKVTAEAESIEKHNEYIDRQELASLGLTKQQTETLANTIELNNSIIEKNMTECNEMLAKIKNVDQDTLSKAIDNFYKSDQYEALLSKLKAETRLSNAQVSYMLGKLPSEIRANNAIAESNIASAKLSDSERKEVDTIVAGLNTDNAMKRWNYLMELRFGKDMREAGLSKAEYESSTAYRVLDGCSKFWNGLVTGVGVYLGFKTAKGKTARNYSNPDRTNTTRNYLTPVQ